MDLRMKFGFVFSILGFLLIGLDTLLEVWSGNIGKATGWTLGVWFIGFCFGNIFGVLVEFFLMIVEKVRGKKD